MKASPILTNYHTHTNFCDGKDTVEAFVKEACKKGFKALGFSSHAPLPFDSEWTMPKEKLDKYIESLADLQNKYQQKIEIYTGLEYDYLGEGVISNYTHGFDSRLDYTILSVHFLGIYKDGTHWTIDGTFAEIQKGIIETFGGDAKKAVKTYFDYLGDGCLLLKPDIVGHLDLIKLHNKNNCFFDENDLWYKDAAFECLLKIKESGALLEINTGGILRGLVDDFYPSSALLKKAIEIDIPIIINADAHTKENIDGCYQKAYDTVIAMGLKEHYVIGRGKKHLKIPLA